MTPLLAHPAFLWASLPLALAALLLGLRAHLAPGFGVRVVGQRPLIQGAGLALVLAGAGLGLAEPRWGEPDVPRLTVHVILDASRSMLAADCGGQSRWRAAQAFLDALWTRSHPDLRYSLDLLTGDLVPVLPPGEDRRLLQDTLRAVAPGDLGSPGTSFAKGITQAAAQADPKAPAILLLLSDGEETWEEAEQARIRAGAALRKARLPLYAVCFGRSQAQPVAQPAAQPTAQAGAHQGARSLGRSAASPGAPEPAFTQARPPFLEALARDNGGRLLREGEDPGPLLEDLARGRAPMPLRRSLTPAHPEWGAWIALLGMVLWLAAAGRPRSAWRPFLGLLLALGLAPASRAELPQSIRAWMAQEALGRGDLAAARRWKPGGDHPRHRLLAAHIEARSGDPRAALTTLAPLIGQGAPRPLPAWRAPALLLAARAWMAQGRPEEARNLLERLLQEEPGRPEAVHDLQTLLKDPAPPSPRRKPPPPPPPRPSQGARQDELEGLKQRLPHRTSPPGGIKDL